MTVRILTGDCRELLATLPDASVHCCVTSPPYFGLRDYGCDGQMGLEATPDEFVAGMVAVFREVRRVLRDDGTLWLNIGDSYAGSGKGGNKAKDLIGIPWLLAFALRADGWYLRQDIIWSKPNPMPESVRDRCTKAHEYLFLLSKGPRYYFDQAAIAEPSSLESEARRERADLRGKDGWADAYHGNPPTGLARQRPRGHARSHDGFNGKWDGMSKLEQCSGTRNKRSVWEVATQPFSEAHFATFPPALIEPCILAGCPQGGTVLDPFGGAGTTGLVADRLQRDAILIELNPEYAEIARNRLAGDGGMFSEVLAA